MFWEAIGVWEDGLGVGVDGQGIAANWCLVQTSSSTCPLPPTFWPRPRLRSISLPFPRARTYDYILNHGYSGQQELISA